MTIWLGYGRKSYIDDGDRREIESTDRQRERLQTWADGRKTTLEVYIEPDGHRSGRSTKQRPEYLKLRDRIRRARPGEIDGVVVTRIDRTSRSPADFYAFLNELRERAIDYVAIDQAFDTTTANGRLMLHLLVAVAAWEADIASERTIEAIRDRQGRGIYVGRTLYGYDRSRVTSDAGHTAATLAINPVEAERVRALFHRYVYEHAGPSELARWANSQGWPSAMIGHWSAATIQRMLDNAMLYVGYVKMYHGKSRRGYDLVVGQHPAIISTEEARAVLHALATRHTNNGGRRSPDTIWPLTGRIWCGECGSRMGGWRRWDERDRLLYRCRKDRACTQLTVDALAVEHQVWQRMSETVQWIDAETARAIASMLQEERPTPAAEPIAVAEVEQEIGRLDYLFRKGRIAETAYERERAVLADMLACMETQPIAAQPALSVDTARRLLAALDLALRSASRQALQKVVEAAVARVEVLGGVVTTLQLVPEIEALRHALIVSTTN